MPMAPPNATVPTSLFMYFMVSYMARQGTTYAYTIMSGCAMQVAKKCKNAHAIAAMEPSHNVTVAPYIIKHQHPCYQR